MNYFTITKLLKLFDIEKKKSSIYREEKKGTIPKATRIKRGASFARVWKLEDIPIIGEKFGYLQKPKSTKIISVYTPKGGVLKSTLTFNLSRILSLNGIKTLVIGLDVQGTVTNNLSKNITYDLDDIDNITEYTGIYEFIKSTTKKYLHDIILPTDIPTLHFIPENPSLNLLEQHIRETNRREYFIADLIEQVKNDYHVIIFDNSPSWNFLIQNSLVAATDVISPISCDIEAYRSLALNIKMINDFKIKMKLGWGNYILVPTKLENNNLSTQIEARYRTSYSKIILNSSIRATIKGQESSLEKLSVAENIPSSVLANDYYTVAKLLWEKING